MTCFVVALAVVIAAPPETPETDAPACLVSGTPKNWDGLEVAPAGGSAFAFALVKVPAAVLFTPGGERVTITVSAPLRFEATAPLASVPLFARRTMRLLDGVVTLSPKSALEATEARTDALLAKIQLDGVSVDAIPFAYAALTLGDGDVLPARAVMPPEARRLVPTGRDILLRPASDAEPVLRLAVDAGGELMLERLGALGDAIRVGASWRDGTRLAGWTPQASVASIRVALLNGEAGFLHGLCGRSGGWGYEGPAILHPGAEVFDAADGHAWATATRTVAVTVQGDSDWVQLETVPGLGESLDCELLDHAFVRAEDLTFPPH